MFLNVLWKYSIKVKYKKWTIIYVKLKYRINICYQQFIPRPLSITCSFYSLRNPRLYCHLPDDFYDRDGRARTLDGTDSHRHYRPVIRQIENHHKTHDFGSVVGRIDSNRTQPDVRIIVLSVDSGTTAILKTVVDVQVAEYVALTCNGFAVNHKYIYNQSLLVLREWCVQWWHAEHRSLSEV